MKNYFPYRIINKCHGCRPKPQNHAEQFFVFSDNSVVKPENFRTVLKKMIVKAGLDPANYDTHSLRIGRATNLFKMGTSVETIKKVGRWCHTSYYIKSPLYPNSTDMLSNNFL